MLWKSIQGNVHVKSFTFSLENPTLPVLSWSFQAVARETSHFPFLTSTICEGTLDLASAGCEIAIATC